MNRTSEGKRNLLIFFLRGGWGPHPVELGATTIPGSAERTICSAGSNLDRLATSQASILSPSTLSEVPIELIYFERDAFSLMIK